MAAPELAEAEAAAARELARLAGGGSGGRASPLSSSSSANFDVASWLASSPLAARLSEQQRAAVVAAVAGGSSSNGSGGGRAPRTSSSSVLLLTGGPGTGKTATTAAVVGAWLASGKRVALAAPTGRAAQRLQEVTGFPASTVRLIFFCGAEKKTQNKYVYKKNSTSNLSLLFPPPLNNNNNNNKRKSPQLHRLLAGGSGGSQPAGSKRDAAAAAAAGGGLGENDSSVVAVEAFRHNAGNPLPHDALLIDEASLLDAPLAAALLQALKPGASLVLVGDPDQLPPVGPGAFLEDAVSSSFEIGGGGGEQEVSGGEEEKTRAPPPSSLPLLPRVHLSRRFRQSSRSAIVDAALAAHAGRAPLPLRALSAEELLFDPRRGGAGGKNSASAAAPPTPLPSEALLVVPGALQGAAGLLPSSSSSATSLPSGYEHELRAVLTTLLPSAGFDPVSDVQASFLNIFLFFAFFAEERERGSIER